MLYVIFSKDGQPEWIGPEPREGSEEVEDLNVEFLVAHVRTPEGEWIPRPPPPAPTEAEMQAMAAEIARQTAEDAVRAAEEREIEIARRALPASLLRSMGKITIAELTARVAVIRADVEAGN